MAAEIHDASNGVGDKGTGAGKDKGGAGAGF
jgi:hypothetical protein